MESGQFKQANLAYEWIVYQSGDTEITTEARLRRARALKKLGELNRALDVLSTINLMSAEPKLQQAILYEEILLRYLNSDYQGANSKGLFGRSLFNEGEYLKPYLLLMSLSHYQLQDYQKGKEFGQQYLEILDSKMKNQLIHEFDSLVNRPKPVLKNPTKARNLSTFLPGIGQIYAGDTGEGLLSFGLHSISLGGAVLAALNGYYITAWLGAAIIVQRLHAGGRMKAAELATKKNRLEISLYSQPIIEFLLRSDPST